MAKTNQRRPEQSCSYPPEAGGGCFGDGWLLDEATNEARPCRCRADRIAEAKVAKLSRAIPPRFQEARLGRGWWDESIEREVAQFVRAADRHLGEGQGLFFFGDRGTGKTSLAIACIREFMERGHTVAIYNARDLVTRLHLSTVSRDGEESVLTLLDRLASVDLLLIDDLAVTIDREWVQQLLYSLVNRRYEDKRSMLITADVPSPDKLADSIGWRTCSRILEACDEIPVFGADRRIAYQPQEAG